MAEVLYFVEYVKERNAGQTNCSFASVKTAGAFPISACSNSLYTQICGCNLRWNV